MVCVDSHENFLIYELTVTGIIWTCRTIKYQQKRLFVIKNFETITLKNKRQFMKALHLRFEHHFHGGRYTQTRPAKVTNEEL